MGLVLTAAPTVEPITVGQAKAHLRIDHDEEDTFLTSLISTSRLQIEAALDLALITQSWSWRFDSWPGGHEVQLPLWPVQSVDTVRTACKCEAFLAKSADEFILDGTSKPARLISKSGAWPQPGIPALGIEIAFKAGFGDAANDVPEPIRQALLMLVAHWYEHREPLEIGTEATSIPNAISGLLRPYRRVRL